MIDEKEGAVGMIVVEEEELAGRRSNFDATLYNTHLLLTQGV